MTVWTQGRVKCIEERSWYSTETCDCIDTETYDCMDTEVYATQGPFRVPLMCVEQLCVETCMCVCVCVCLCVYVCVCRCCSLTTCHKTQKRLNVFTQIHMTV